MYVGEQVRLRSDNQMLRCDQTPYRSRCVSPSPTFHNDSSTWGVAWSWNIALEKSKRLRSINPQLPALGVAVSISWCWGLVKHEVVWMSCWMVLMGAWDRGIHSFLFKPYMLQSTAARGVKWHDKNPGLAYDLPEGQRTRRHLPRAPLFDWIGSAWELRGCWQGRDPEHGCTTDCPSFQTQYSERGDVLYL